ncbi:MAG TPA: J domain-containing protein [Polyangiaceae bacterium]|nr:J domain-containing protein [Polyangiaceae bacterium]
MYKAEHKTFDVFCAACFDMRRTYAHYLIESAAVVHNCEQANVSPPTKEAHARELAKLPPSKQPKAWAKAMETAPSGIVTAKHVASIVAAQLPKRGPAKVSRIALRERVAATSVLTDLEKLVEQRNADPEFGVMRAIQQALGANLPSRAHRILNFVINGGELALLRLGLDWTVTEETLKRAFRASSLDAHPDRGGSQEEFVALTQANQLVLTMLGAAG